MKGDRYELVNCIKSHDYFYKPPQILGLLLEIPTELALTLRLLPLILQLSKFLGNPDFSESSNYCLWPYTKVVQ